MDVFELYVKSWIEKKDIINCAIDLANMEGIQNVTITSLAQNLHIQKPSLYNHISSLLDVQEEIAKTGWKSINESVSKICSQHLHQRDFYQALSESVCMYVQRNPGVFEAMVMENQQETAIREGTKIKEIVYEMNQDKRITENEYRMYIRSLIGYLMIRNRKNCEGDKEDFYKDFCQTLMY